MARRQFSAAVFVFVGWNRSSCYHRGFEAGSQPCSLFYFSFWAGFYLISRRDVIDVVAAFVFVFDAAGRRRREATRFDFPIVELGR